MATAVVASLALISACAPAPTPPRDTPQAEAPVASRAEPQPSSPVPAVELTPVNRSEFDKRIEAFKGKVVAVDFWATWCRPCLEQLPHTFALASEHGDQVAVVTVCMEDAESTEAITRTLARLAGKSDRHVLNLLSKDGGGPDAMEAFKVPGGALPYYRIYDRAGKLRHEFALDPLAEKQFTSDDVASAVKALLAE